ELLSLSVKVVVVLEPGAPTAGVKTRAASSGLRVAGAAAAREWAPPPSLVGGVLPLNVPVAPSPLSVMVIVSVAARLLSATVTPANGLTAVSCVVVRVGVVTAMVGATAASVSVTVTVAGVALVPAELLSLSVKVVVVLEPGAPTAGVKTRAASSGLRGGGAAAARV